MIINAATAKELEYFRTDGQHSQLYLAFPQPAIVFKALVNNVAIKNDMITSIPYDTVTFGLYSNIIPDMTLLVGSDDGECDLGIARIRKVPVAEGVLYIGETSEVKFADNMYLTVIDEYGLWPRHKYVQSGPTHVDFMDFDIAYTDQHSLLDPVPVLGPDVVLDYHGILGEGNTISITRDGSGSYCLGSSIKPDPDGHAWTAPTASATSGLNTATPSFTFNTPGTHRITDDVTAANGKHFVGRRIVMVFDDTFRPVSDFKLSSCSGDFTDGGWEFKVTMYDNAARGLIRDRAQVILFARDWYGDTEKSIGPVSGSENIMASGWIDKEDLNLDIKGGTAKFTVHGPHYWLGKMEGFISGLRHSETAPTEWNYMLDLTVDKGLWDLLHWKTTATVMMDIILTGVVQLIPTMESVSIGSLWEQLTGMAYSTMLATACCDRYGRLFVEINGQYVPRDERNFTNVMTVEAYDRTGEIELEHVTVQPVSLIDLSGVWYDGVTGHAVRALAPGHIMGRYGQEEPVDKLILADQGRCNELAALVLAQRNNEYPKMSIVLASNMRLIDICPQQQLYVVTSTDLNPREVIVSNNIFVRSISFVFDDKSQSISVEVDGQPETVEIVNVVPGDIPIPLYPPPIPPIPWVPPPFPPILPPVPPIPPIPPPIPPPPGDCVDSTGVNGPFTVSWDRVWIDGNPATPETRSARAWFSCTIRSTSGALWPTRLEITVGSTGPGYQHLHIYGIDKSEARIATGTLTLVTYTEDYKTFFFDATFDLAGPLTVAGFELTIDEGYDTVGAEFDLDKLVEYQPVSGVYIGGTGQAEITDVMSHTVMASNQIVFRWGGWSLSPSAGWTGDNHDVYYQTRIFGQIKLYLKAGQKSKIWAFVGLQPGTDITAMNGPIIPLGPDYGPGVGNWAYYPHFSNEAFCDFLGGGVEYSDLFPFYGEWQHGGAQTTHNNPCIRDAPAAAEFVVTVIASDSIPVPWVVSLGPLVIYNVCL
jgi:hypothetical protein